VLITGEFWLAFRRSSDDESREVRLCRPGDYVLWGPAHEHTWRAVTDAVVLTVRWPTAVHPAEHAAS
jgi:hypothetical protein